MGQFLSYLVAYAIITLVKLEICRDSPMVALSGNGKGERYEFR